MCVQFLYADDDIDEGLIFVFIDHSEEGVLLDAQFAELLGQVFHFLGVVKRAGIVVYGEFFLAIAELQAHEIFDEILERSS